MKSVTLIFILCLCGCNTSQQVKKEPWIEQAVDTWPYFALTNEISFADTTYYDIANSFLINTGFDTIGVSCKHLFMVFENQLGINTIDLGNRFHYWYMYPKNQKSELVTVKRLINSNANERVGHFSSLKNHDLIVFELKGKGDALYPLKVRYTPVKKNETVYAVGWGMNQKDNSQPVLIKLQCFKNAGDYFYTSSLNADTDARGRSGSPVIDQNGYLVGIVSGQEGNLGVISGVNYLKRVFDRYGIRYMISYSSG